MTLTEKYEDGASKYWNSFYSRNERNFFKDRHWILREFTEMSPNETAQKNVLDLGCGVGNTLFPLLEKLPSSYHFYACDFSSKAITLLQQCPTYDSKRVTSFVCDISKEEFPPFIRGADFVLLIFVLSAIAPQDYPSIVSKLYEAIAPGGIVFIRDYGRGDLAQKRFAEKQERDATLSDNFYVRADGTRAYYFHIDELSSLFCSRGFVLLQNQVVNRTVENKKRALSMDRSWLQAKFKKSFE